MKLSVLLITYNHEAYIEEALISVINQVASFEFDVIIADDCSTDNTMNIIKSCERNTNLKFTYLETPINLGLVKNYQRAIKACKSEYVAVLEGDDYWTDPLRLQKHVDFLDENENCVMTYNRATTLLQENGRFEIVNKEKILSNKFVTDYEIAAGNCIGNFSMCVYRTSALDKLDNGIFNLNMADWLFNLAVAQSGLIGFIGEIMSVYRVHQSGEWSGMNRVSKLKAEFEAAKQYNRFFKGKYKKEFKSLQAYIQQEIDKELGVKRIDKAFIKSFMPPLILRLLKYVKCKNK